MTQFIYVSNDRANLAVFIRKNKENGGFKFIKSNKESYEITGFIDIKDIESNKYLVLS